MKITRSSKCYFNKWLTQKKMSELRDILQEYTRVCNYFVETYENEIPKKSKFDLLLAVYIQKCVVETNTFLTARLIKQAFSEAYGAVQSAKSNAENRKDKKYFRPTFNGKKMILSECSQVHSIAEVTQLFDYNITLICLRTDKGKGYKISIPLKKHIQFNKWNNLGKITKSVTITDKYVMFFFEIETGEKKQEGTLLGFDFGMKRLGTMSDGTVIGRDIEKLLYQLRGKKCYSKSYYRKKEEIKENNSNEKNDEEKYRLFKGKV